MKRILVIRGGAIGDFILTLPAIKLLRENYPRAEIEILGHSQIAVLTENRFYASAVHSIDDARLASFFVIAAELSPELVTYIGSFDLVISYVVDVDYVFETNIRRCGGGNFIAAESKLAGTEHAARQLARPLAQIGLSLGDAAARLYPSGAERDFAQTFTLPFGQPIVAVHPGSGSAAKNWPIENWVSLCQWILETRRATTLLIVTGEADKTRMRSLQSALPSSAVRFAENLALPRLAAVFERCDLFLGHDSGISHVAAAVGTRCILLFGPSDPRVWAPANSGVTVVTAAGGAMRDLRMDAVKNAVRAALD